ncbi:MAG: ATP-dependent protease LonB [Clostridia bacterium]|nr:ATP-dependent protease LonB [Clostridia bacterium]
MSNIGVLGLINLVFAAVIGLYFWNLLRAQQGSKSAVDRESRREMEKLRELRAISLTKPLTEMTRPTCLEDVIGQADAIRALRAALCGPNPQHVILYGPPGVGKTAAARVVLEEAKKCSLSPFKDHAKFVEIDANTARFDDRGIADPLIGSVHDPIYQGAGPLGIAGIPQPKPGAVTKAHGGVLFIDEIGELHPVQMNKLLKVLEDRRVFLESAYYSSEDASIPQHIHDIFTNGLPADFRLIGATTRSNQEIPPAIRSRCLEVYFRALSPSEVGKVASGALDKLHMQAQEGVLDIIMKYAQNGRDAVNMVQLAAGVAITDGHQMVLQSDMEWVVESGRHSPRPERRIPDKPAIGVVNALAVWGASMGALIEIEASASPAIGGKDPCAFTVTGVVDEEEQGDGSKVIRRRSMARSSVDNVATVLRSRFGVDLSSYHIHVNFPGGGPVDGPSAGVAMAIAVLSAVRRTPVDNRIAITGELSILGAVKPVGGVPAKIDAAAAAGASKVLIPAENWQDRFADRADIQAVAISDISEAVALAAKCADDAPLGLPHDLVVLPGVAASSLSSVTPASPVSPAVSATQTKTTVAATQVAVATTR